MEIVKGKRTKRPRPYSPEISGSISEEEEDMANCLILLAQGFSPKPEEVNEEEEERPLNITERSGFYIYECKTCNRSFPSFQALGGHRASHKKPKSADIVVITDQKSDKEKEVVKGYFDNFIPPTLSLHVAPAKQANNKVHECSICGAEFSSGQALGGHMRRHRATTKAVECRGENNTEINHKPINLLGFDLNLPAPVEDDQIVTDVKFEFMANKHIVFSAATLVDCHY